MTTFRANRVTLLVSGVVLLLVGWPDARLIGNVSTPEAAASEAAPEEILFTEEDLELEDEYGAEEPAEAAAQDVTAVAENAVVEEVLLETTDAVTDADGDGFADWYAAETLLDWVCCELGGQCGYYQASACLPGMKQVACPCPSPAPPSSSQ